MSIREDVEKIEKKAEEIEQESIAMELIKDYKKNDKRLFVISIILIIYSAIITAFYIYTLNDIDTETITTTKSYDIDKQDVSDTGDINNSHIINGEVHGTD